MALRSNGDRAGHGRKERAHRGKARVRWEGPWRQRKGLRVLTEEDLRRLLDEADRRGYPAYKRLRGAYDLEWFTLSIDHVQGDPFAAPSQVSAWVALDEAGIPAELIEVPHRRVAVEDLLVRRLSRELAKRSFKVGGSGKSGLLATSRPGPEVLSRSACEVSAGGVTLRFEVGFPAHGRTTDARALERILCELVPDALDAALDRAVLAQEAQRAVELADDQRAIRGELERRGLVAFVADGAVLPRESGVSSRPLKGAKPFSAPDSLAVELDLPHAGRVRGMGVPEGVTLIVGGGFHGKSTLLQALQEGVYNHVAGDGRELVIARADAVKLRAEDGRSVREVDISPFIGDVPDGRDTACFSTQNASGSTSQAAATVEAVRAGCRTLLIDEDTSATNFMVRDALMEAVVAREAEPITPFVERARDLWEGAGVSCVIVAGSSGAFFSVADTVIQMQAYEPLDVTERVRAVCRERGVGESRASGFVLPTDARPIRLAVADEGEARRASGRGGSRARDGRGKAHGKSGSGGRDGRAANSAAAPRLKVRTRGLDELSVGAGSVDVRLIEQLVDAEQVVAIAQLVRRAFEQNLLNGTRNAAQVADVLLNELDGEGWKACAPHGTAACGLARPRREELIAALNRWRG